jgi:hypothetical protein
MEGPRARRWPLHEPRWRRRWDHPAQLRQWRGRCGFEISSSNHGEAVLVESNSDPSFCAPYNTAGEPRTVCHEYELVRDANKTGNVELGSDIRSIPNDTRECAAAELNGSGLEDTMARGFPARPSLPSSPSPAQFTIHHIPPKPAGRDVIPIKKQPGPIRESDLKASAPRDGLVFNDANAV